MHKRIPWPPFVVGLILLTGCKGDDKQPFVAACTANGQYGGACECYYDVAVDALSDQQFELYKAMLLNDTQKMAKIQASFGLVDGAEAAARLAWVGANAQAACGQ